LVDSDAVGKLRHIIVGINGLIFNLLEIHSLIEEFFDQILATVAAKPADQGM
jgi:hypothetical protein